MGRTNNFFSGGIRRKIFSMLLITILLIIAAYTAVYLFQSARVEQLVGDIYEEQAQVFADNDLEEQYNGLQNRAVSAFHREMFHARNILILSVAAIVAAGMAFAASITNRIIDPLNTITRRVASLGVRNRQFQMEDVYKTGDEIEVLAESFAKLSARTVLYIEQIKRVTSEKGKNFSLHAYMRPAREVGGDFYDYFMIDDDHVGLVMADVSGKGIPAALLMMISRVLIKTHLQSGKTPGEALFSANNQICAKNESDFFVTAWVASIELSTGKGVAVNAGHEHPILCRAGGQYELIKYRHALPLGTMEGVVFKEREFEMHPGDSLFVYTDGVAEATDPRGELFGTDRILETLNADPDAETHTVLATMMEKIDSFAAEAEQFDDITMLSFRYQG